MKIFTVLVTLMSIAPLASFAQERIPNPPARRLDFPSNRGNIITLSPGMSVDLMPYQAVTVSCGGAILPPIGLPPRNPECAIEKTSAYNFNISAGGILQDSKSYFNDAIRVVENLQAASLCAPMDLSVRDLCRVEKTSAYNYNILIGSKLIESKSYQNDTTTVISELRRVGLCR